MFNRIVFGFSCGFLTVDEHKSTTVNPKTSSSLNIEVSLSELTLNNSKVDLSKIDILATVFGMHALVDMMKFNELG